MSLTKKSKFLSFILRHKPEAAKLTMTKDGWVDVKQLLSNTDITETELLEIVASDEKQRYAITDGRIRANQGHSINVEVALTKAIPPTVLYHGTNVGVLASILKTGLQKQKRNHVHLSSDLVTAKDVGGRRRGDLVILAVDCKSMLADKFQFFISANKVWLIDSVPAKYLSVVKLDENGE